MTMNPIVKHFGFTVRYCHKTDRFVAWLSKDQTLMGDGETIEEAADDLEIRIAATAKGILASPHRVLPAGETDPMSSGTFLRAEPDPTMIPLTSVTWRDD